MGILDDQAAIRKQRLADDRARREAFNTTPPGRARSARRNGRKVFQIDLPLSSTRGTSLPLIGTFATSTETVDSAAIIELIEAEGWVLSDVGYIYRIMGSTSRDRWLLSGQNEAMHGEIVGIYLFRATEGPAPHAEQVVPALPELGVTIDFR